MQKFYFPVDNSCLVGLGELHTWGMDATQIKVKNPRDLFSIVPYALGYQPEESILVICIREAGGLGMIARTSLSDLRDPECCIQIGQMVARSATDDATARAFIVVYCQANDEFTLHGYKKQAKFFADHLRHIPTETWVITTKRYYRVDCQGEGCCPAEGFPIEELANTEASAALVYRGYAPARSREEYLKLPEPAPAATRAATLAGNKFNTEISKVETWRQRAFATWQNALEMVGQTPLSGQAKQLPPKVLGVLATALTDTTMRDAVLLSCLPGGLVTALEVVQNTESAQHTASELLAGVVGGDDHELPPIPPPQLHLRKATIVLEAVAAHANPRGKAGPLALLAFLAWWAGDGTRANTRARQALEAQPNYQLAVILAEAIESHLQPSWIRSRHRLAMAA